MIAVPNLLAAATAPLQAESAPSRVALWVVAIYLAMLIGFSFISRARLKKSSAGDFFVASRSIGPFLLLMSVFGTTMTAFALVGSTGKAFQRGVGVYGFMASISGIVHSLVFFLVGIRLWALGKRFGYVTQIQYFRARFRSDLLGWLLFPILVLLSIPYILLGILGAGAVIRGISRGMFPEAFGSVGPAAGAIPPWLTGIVVCGVVLFYVLTGGVRAAALANAAQTIVFMAVGVLAFFLISDSLGGVQAATAAVQDAAPELLTREPIGQLEFLTYMLVPLSVGMFPHLFQHWLTARNAKTFRMTVVAHPLFIMIVWLPCVLIGVWAVGAGIEAPGGNINAVLPRVIDQQLHDPLMTGLLTAGILAAIMSSLDSQFVCLGTMFTHDVVIRLAGERRFDERQQVLVGRLFIFAVALVTYVLSLFPPPSIFDLAVWCFSGFASLFPLVFGAIYWRRATKQGAIASVLAGAVTWAVLFYDGLLRPALAGEPTSEDYLIFGMMPVAPMVAVSTIVFVGVSLLTPPLPAEHVDRFFVRPSAVRR